MDNEQIKLLHLCKVVDCAYQALLSLKRLQHNLGRIERRKISIVKRTKPSPVEKKKNLSSVDKHKRSCCVREVNRDRNRNGFFTVSFQKIKQSDTAQFFVYTRMSPQLFNTLLNLLKPHMIKTSMRKPISPECRLAVILQFLCQGTSLQALADSFKLGKETVRSIVLETSEIIWGTLFPIYVSEPTVDDFKQIRLDFLNLCNFPSCVGAVAGKHIAISCLPHVGNKPYYSNKSSSIVLLAVCDAKYRFTYVDIGPYGSQTDKGILQVSQFGHRLLNNSLPVPAPKELPNTQTKVPHYFVADTTFPLGPTLMRPYAGAELSPEKENFNKRLSKATRTIDNALGILVARWRILLTTLHMFPKNAEKITLACVALHNFIMMNSDSVPSYCPNDFVDWQGSDGKEHDGMWRSEVEDNIPSISPSASTHFFGDKSSTNFRNIISDYLIQN